MKTVILGLLLLVFSLCTAAMVHRLVTMTLPGYPTEVLETKLLLDLPPSLHESALAFVARFRRIMLEDYLYGTAHPWWLSHSLLAFVWCVTGGLQFVGPLRRALPTLHRYVGRVFLITCACLAVTGAMLGQLSHTGAQLTTASYILSGGTLLSIWCAWRAARRRDFATHKKWATRVAALTLGPPLHRLVFVGFSVVNIEYLHKMALEGEVGDMWFREVFAHSMWLSFVAAAIGGEVAVALTTPEQTSSSKRKRK